MIYIVNYTEHNYSSARKYGDIMPITTGKVSIFKTDTMIGLLKDKLDAFTDEDYLLVSGPTWLCMMASSMLFTKFKQIKFLIFDAKEQCYVVRHLDHTALALDDK